MSQAPLRPRLGYRPDPQDVRDWSIVHMGLEGAVPESVSLRRYVDTVLDQGDTESCVAHAWVQALHLGERINGDPQPEVASRLFVYFNARAWHGDEHVDAGTYLRTCAKGLMQFGRAREETWPFDTAKVNTQPSWASYREAADYRGPGGYYRIGQGDLASIRAAIANQVPVVFGMPVDEAFCELQGPSVIGKASGPAIGGHAMCVVGYDGDTFEIVNSWGTGWRDGGFARLTAERMATASDLWGVDL